MKNKLLISIILFAVISAQSYAQTYVADVSKKGTTAAPFLSIGQGARATAMGSAFVSVADDPSALYWNPAGLTKVQGIGALFDHTEWFAGVKYNYVALSYNAGDYGAIGIGFTSSDMGDMKVTTIEEPDGTGEIFKAADVALSLSYAISLTDNFSIGISPKFISQSIWRMTATAFAVDMGVQYRTPFDGAILSMSISNFGSKMQLSGNTALTLIKVGENDKVPTYLQTEEWAIPLNFRVGLAYQPIRTEMHILTVALDAQHPNDNYESINFGGEYLFNNLLAIRGGYKDLFLPDPEFGFTAGFGLKQQVMGNVTLRFDYSYEKLVHLGNIQKFSVGVNL